MSEKNEVEKLCEGKTILGVYFDSVVLVLRFNDGTWILVEASRDQDSDALQLATITTTDPRYHYPPGLLEAGVITQADVDRKILMFRKAAEERRERQDRAQYEELKKRFEPEKKEKE